MELKTLTSSSGLISSALSSPILSSNSGYLCKVCGANATGVHYGILACNACRAFFRRAVVRILPYICDYDDRCIVNVEEKVICPACRFMKCIKIGMKYDGVTKPVNGVRVPVSHLKNKGANLGADMVLQTTQTISISYLMDSFYMSKKYSECGIEIPSTDAFVIQNSWPTYVLAYHNAMQVEVMTMVEWAKRIPGFKDLVVDDQITLLREAARKHAFLRWAYLTANSSDKEITHLILRDNVRVPVLFTKLNIVGIDDTVDLDFYECIFTKMKKGATPLRDWGVTEEELVCFEALLLLNPNVKGLRNREKVMRLRRNVQTVVMAESMVNPSFLCRIMDLHLLLSALNHTGFKSVRAMANTNFFGVLGKVSKLLEDLIWFPELVLEPEPICLTSQANK